MVAELVQEPVTRLPRVAEAERVPTLWRGSKGLWKPPTATWWVLAQPEVLQALMGLLVVLGRMATF